MSTSACSSKESVNFRRLVFEFIMDVYSGWNRLPTRGEIHKAFEGRIDDVDLHLEQLVREELLELPAGSNLNVSLVPTFKQAPSLKLRANVLTKPHSPEEMAQPNTISLDLRGIGIPVQEDMYVIPISDDSMSDAGLLKGDLAIMSCASPQRGDIVCLEDHENPPILRRLVQIHSIPHLLAENPLPT